jgi:spore maturation protein CgeB
MRILFLTVDYPPALQARYGVPGADAAERSYADLYAENRAALFSPGLAEAFESLGHAALDARVNNLPLQRAWQRERATSTVGRDRWVRHLVFHMRRLVSRGRIFVLSLRPRGNLPPLPAALFDSRNPEIQEIVATQIAKWRPDIVYNFDPVAIDGSFLVSLKHLFGALVAQIASPLSSRVDWSRYNLVISSLPNLVQTIEQRGVRAVYLPLFFVPEVLEYVPPRRRDIELSFVGSITPAHTSRRDFLNQISANLPIMLYGSFRDEDDGSALARAYQGPAFGRQMFEVMARSRLTLNKHIDVAENYANNMRLFEATGMGACLVTERAVNLPELFEPDREVVAYGDADECISLCQYYLDRPSQAETVAAAGQRRCLDDHNAVRRSEQLITILRTRL